MTPHINEIINRQLHNWDRVKSILHRLPGEDEEGTPAGAGRQQPVIAFSRELGCGSRLVADIISHRTGYEIFGWSLIDKVAEDIHAQRRIVDRLDETSVSQIEGLIEGMMWGRHVDREEHFRGLLRVLRASIVQGGVVILGRGGTFVVEKNEGIRVRIVAPMEVRVQNLRVFANMDDRTALQRIQESDKQRAAFIHSYFKKDIADPMNYDLILNMGSLTPETAAAVVLRALEQFAH